MKILNKLQVEAFKIIASTAWIASNFYFTGGTALSEFYLQHRESVDLDFFSERPFDKTPVENVIESLQKNWISVEHLRKIHDRYSFEISWLSSPPCKIDFCYYQYQRLERTGTNFMGIEVDSVRDIWTNKWATVFDRNEPKDVLDIASLSALEWMGKDMKALEATSADVKRKFWLSLKPYTLISQYESRMKTTQAENARGLLYKNIGKLDVFSWLKKRDFGFGF